MFNDIYGNVVFNFIIMISHLISKYSETFSKERPQCCYSCIPTQVLGLPGVISPGVIGVY